MGEKKQQQFGFACSVFP